MANMALTWDVGIDQLTPRSSLPDGAVTDAVNVDIDRAGNVGRRAGYSSVYSSPRVRDLWTSVPRGQSFCVVNSVLQRITMPFSLTPIYTFAQDAPVSYCDLNGDVVVSSMYEAIVVGPDLAVRALAMARPATPVIAVSTAGGLDAGTYGVALSYLRSDEEGPLSFTSFINVPAGGGILVTFPGTVRIYRTKANGDVLYRAAGRVSTGSYLLGAATLGRQCTNQFLAPMIPGDFVTYWRGLLWTVRANVAYYSEPMRYGVYSPRYNFIQVARPIRIFEAVNGGIFIGTADGVFFLSGNEPKDFNLKVTSGHPPIKGSGQIVPASVLGPEQGDTGAHYALWLSDNGYVLGSPDGNVIEKQRRRINLSSTSGTAATVVHDRRVVTVVN